ncbi:MAG: DEAD/DEAH box helicase, partial [Caldilineaceae bacterium]
PAHALYQDWVGWIEQLHETAADAQFRVAFALDVPEAQEQSRWVLRYFLQARSDPTLTVSAQQVWQEKSHSLRLGEMRFDQPQERLLAGLGIASRLFPPIKESLRTSRPEMALLSTAEAHQFLREIGPLLESSGFGLILPDWWQRRGRSRLGLRLRLYSDRSGQERSLNGSMTERENGQKAAQKTSTFNLNSLIRYRWELALGDETLDQQEFEKLIAMQSPLVNIRGRWLEMDPAQVAAARSFLQNNQSEGQTNLLQAMRLAQSYSDVDRTSPPAPEVGERLGVGVDLPDDLPLDTVEIEGWLDVVLQRLRSADSIDELAEPSGFIGTLRPYQRRGAGWLWYLRQLGLGACLADDMGLGKTIEAIGLLLHAREVAASQGEVLPPTLLICPTSVVANWRHEIERFAPTMRALVHHGSGRLTGEEFGEALTRHELVITSYGTARRDIELLSQTEWSTLILDEAQNIKNPAAKQTQAVRRIPAASRIALTGTPVENRLLELWSIMEFLNPGYLGSRENFRQQFVLPIERYNDETAAAELRRLVQPFLLRRLKTDPTIITDLPEKNEMIVYCPLSEEQAKLYNDVVAETMARVEASEGIQRRGLVLSLLLKLKQVCNHPAHYLGQQKPLVGRSGKLSRLTAMVEEALSVDDRALIFTQFVEMGHLLKSHLEETFGRDVLFLHGGTPATKRDQMVQAFQAEKGGPSIFILSLRAGGVGLNLTRANHVFHFDRWWNPAVENQATDRAFRIGQKRAVQVYKFVVAGTLEERINEMIESKQSLAESIVGSGEDWLSELDTDQLRDLLSLRREEIEDEVIG